MVTLSWSVPIQQTFLMAVGDALVGHSVTSKRAAFDFHTFDLMGSSRNVKGFPK